MVTGSAWGRGVRAVLGRGSTQVGLGAVVRQPAIRSGDTASELHQARILEIQACWRRTEGRKPRVPVRASLFLCIREGEDE